MNVKTKYLRLDTNTQNDLLFVVFEIHEIIMQRYLPYFSNFIHRVLNSLNIDLNIAL